MAEFVVGESVLVSEKLSEYEALRVFFHVADERRHDYDISAGQLSPRAEIQSPTGQPLQVRELSMSIDGRALVTASVGVSGLEQLHRGGVHVAAVIDIDDGTIEPALPVRYRTPHAGRRHASPRWCDDRTTLRVARTTLADRLLEAATLPRCDPDLPAIAQDHLQRWLESMLGISSAWETGAMPLTRFARDYVQLAISCAGVAPGTVHDALSTLRARAVREPVARAITDWITRGHRLGTSLAAISPAFVAGPAGKGAPDTSSPPGHQAAAAASVTHLLEAEKQGPRAPGSGQPLVRLSSSCSSTASKLALTCLNARFLRKAAKNSVM